MRVRSLANLARMAGDLALRPLGLGSAQLSSSVQIRLWRYQLGVRPASRRKAVEKQLVSAKPSSMAIQVIDRPCRASNAFARSMRRAVW